MDERYNHYIMQQAGHMQKNQPLYSRWKQSQYQRFCVQPEGTKWEDRDSTSEYDTNIDEQLVQLTKDLQERIETLRSLQQEQPLEEETVALVGQVVPVQSAMPALPMEVDGALPTTMGPGQLEAGEGLPTIFLARTGEEETEEEDVVEMDESEQPQPGPIEEDEGAFDAEREQWLIVSLTQHHDNLVSWQAQCIVL